MFVDGELAIDFDARRVTRNGTTVRLTPKEFDLLKFLVDHPNRADSPPQAAANGLGAGLWR